MESASFFTKDSGITVTIVQRDAFQISPPLTCRLLATSNRSVPEVASAPSSPPLVDLIQQLQEEQGKKKILYLKQHIQLSKVIGEGKEFYR